MTKPKKLREENEWPRYMTAKEIRAEADKLATIIDDYQNEFEELEKEMKRRGLKL